MYWHQKKKKGRRRSSRVMRAQIGKTTSRKTQDSKILVVEKGNSNNSDRDSDWEEKCGVSRDFCCPHTNHCEYFCRRLP